MSKKYHLAELIVIHLLGFRCKHCDFHIQIGNVPEAEMLSSSSVGEVPYTLGSTNGVKEALEPPPPPTPYCRSQKHRIQSVTCLSDGVLVNETTRIKETLC